MSDKQYPIGGYAHLPADDAVQNWFEENIDKECSASSAIYKFRLWLESLQLSQPQGAVWVKASMRLPEYGKAIFIKFAGLRLIGTLYDEAKIGDEQKNCLYFSGEDHFEDQFHLIEWLDESATTSKEKEVDNALYETRLALRMMLKVFKNGQISKEQEKYYSQAEAILKKHGKVTDVLRAPTSNKDEAVAFAEWVRDNTVPDGAPKLFYKPDISRYTIRQLYELWQQNKK